MARRPGGRPARSRPAAAARSVVLVATWALAACGPAAEEAGPAAAPAAAVAAGDRPLAIYSGCSRELMAPLLARFERQSGVAVETRWGESGELAATVLDEGTATPADLFLSRGAAPLGALSRKGLLRELPVELVRAVPPYLAGSEQLHDWVGLSGRARVVVYDPAATSAGLLPRSLDELGEPRHRGRFGLAPAEPSLQAQLAAYRVLHGEEALDRLLARLHANEPRLYAGDGQVARAVAAGEVAWGLVEHVAAGGVDGAPGRVAAHLMSARDGSRFVDVAAVGVLSSDPRALELVRFLLGEEAQAAFAERGEYPLALGTAPSAGLPTLAGLEPPRVDFADVAAVLEETRRAMRRHGLAAGGEGARSE